MIFVASTQNSDSSTDTQGVLIALLDGAEGLFPSRDAGCVGEGTQAQSTSVTAHVGQGGYGAPGSSAVGLGHWAQVWFGMQQ